MIDSSIAVLGSGSWATALVKMLSENCDEVGWYIRNAEDIEFIYQHEHNPNYLKSVEFDVERLKISDDINRVIDISDIIIIAIPSAYLSEQLSKLNVDISEKIILSAVKGFVPETGLIIGEHLQQHYNVPLENFGAIAGPCHAEEIGMERLSYLTIASSNEEITKQSEKLLKSDFVKIRITKDIIGVEYAVALKNIYAIASGIAHGLGYGDNFQAVLVTNAANEMKEFVEVVSESSHNTNTSVYLGDLLVTCYSLFSRNRQFGNRIGKGYRLKSIFSEMTMIAEGYYAIDTAYKTVIDKNISAPIIKAVYEILYNNKNPEKVMRLLTDQLV